MSQRVTYRHVTTPAMHWQFTHCIKLHVAIEARPAELFFTPDQQQSTHHRSRQLQTQFNTPDAPAASLHRVKPVRDPPVSEYFEVWTTLKGAQRVHTSWNITHTRQLAFACKACPI